MSETEDRLYMAEALELARRGIASTDPNPSVGCVIVRDGEVTGRGYTRRAGGNHAEIEALNAAGAAAAGATVYVSLEPCSHTGRTGPCAQALIDAGVARVVFAVPDPNPAVAGRGGAMLAEAGIVTASGVLEAEARKLNCGYFSRHERGRPWLRLKMAASLDGRTALANGQSQWITGEASRRDVHHWRAQSSAILSGSGTVLADDPELTARVENAGIDILQPLRIVIDTKLRTPPGARLLAVPGEVLIFAAEPADSAAEARRHALVEAGAEVETVSAAPHCDLVEVVARLAEREINEVWIEAGPTLAGAMLAAGLVDELVLYFAPCLLGDDARGLFRLPAIDSLEQRRRLVIDEIRQFDPDFRVTATVRES